MSAFATALFERYPLDEFELLRDETTRVAAALQLVARRTPYLPAWLLSWDGTVSVHTVLDLVRETGTGKLANRALVLPPAAGVFLNGLLAGTATAPDGCDVADNRLAVNGMPRRVRRREKDYDPDPPSGMRLLLEYDLGPDAEAHPPPGAGERFFRWYTRVLSVSASPGTPGAGADGVTARAERLADLLLPGREDLRRAISAAARLHALGTKRCVWQRLAGSGTRGDSEAGAASIELAPGLTDYRYEFGSLLDAPVDPGYEALQSDAERDLALHLVAALRGRARPHFPSSEAVDPERPASAWVAAAREVPARFARLQRTHGRWGLAYLESLLRAAVCAPQSPGATVRGEKRPA